MGWVTLSLRKLALTQRVSQLEQRLTRLSQEEQSLSNSQSYAERIIGIDMQDAYSDISSEYSTSLSDITSALSSSGTSSDDISTMLEYQVQFQQSQLDYMYNKMMIDSIFTQQEQLLQDTTNAKQTHLDLEKEQIETQLESARAELEQYDEAISQDIQNSTISLV